MTGTSADGTQLQFQLVATECATALALYGPKEVAIDEISIPDLDCESADR